MLLDTVSEYPHSNNSNNIFILRYFIDLTYIQIKIFPKLLSLNIQGRYIMRKMTFTIELTRVWFSTGGHPEHFDHRECFAPCEFKNDKGPRTTPHTCVSMESLRILMSGIAISWRFGLKSDVFQILIKSMILYKNITKNLF